MRNLLPALLFATTFVPWSSTAAARSTAADGHSAASTTDRRTIAQFPLNVLRRTVGVVTKENIRPALIGSGVTVSVAFFDDEITDAISNPEHSFGQSFEDGASPEVVAAAVGVRFVAGRLSHAPRFRAVTL